MKKNIYILSAFTAICVLLLTTTGCIHEYTPDSFVIKSESEIIKETQKQFKNYGTLTAKSCTEFTIAQSSFAENVDEKYHDNIAGRTVLFSCAEHPEWEVFVKHELSLDSNMFVGSYYQLHYTSNFFCLYYKDELLEYNKKFIEDELLPLKSGEDYRIFERDQTSQYDFDSKFNNFSEFLKDSSTSMSTTIVVNKSCTKDMNLLTEAFSADLIELNYESYLDFDFIFNENVDLNTITKEELYSLTQDENSTVKNINSRMR